MIKFSVNSAKSGTIYQKRIGCYAIICNESSKVALVKVNNQYFLPGGGKDDGESNIECLERECLEEVGAKLSDINEFAQGNYFFYSTRFNIEMESIGYFFTCRIVEIFKANSEDNLELVWIDAKLAIESLYLLNQKEALKLFTETI